MPAQSISPGFAQRAEPETFRARGISAMLAVKDIQKSLAWYRDKLGFYVEQKFERSGKLTGAALKAGDVRILISQDDGGTGWEVDVAHGLFYGIFRRIRPRQSPVNCFFRSS